MNFNVLNFIYFLYNQHLVLPKIQPDRNLLLVHLFDILNRIDVRDAISGLAEFLAGLDETHCTYNELVACYSNN